MEGVGEESGGQCSLRVQGCLSSESVVDCSIVCKGLGCVVVM